MCAAALNLGQFVDDAAAVVWAVVAVVWATAVVAVVWAAAVAVVSAAAAVDGVSAAAAELATAVLTWRACGAVTACLGVDPGPGSAVAPLHVAV